MPTIPGLDEQDRGLSWWSPYSWLQWKPPMMADLLDAEHRMLSRVWHLIDSKFVSISNGSKQIRTIVLNTKSIKMPLVLIHGMGSGVGLWSLNLHSLSLHRPVYAFDLLGFAGSSRPEFSSDSMLAEMELVESVEEWRQEMKLDKFILLGHSLGGFLSMSYAIRYPNRIAHLILVDPWGFPERPLDAERRTPLPAWVKMLATVLQVFNPLAVLRAAGPWGAKVVSFFRTDLIRKFDDFDDDTVAQYVFQCNARKPTGEVAFRNMTIPIGWAKHPMIRRVNDLPLDIPISMLYGSRSWIDSSVGWQVKFQRNDTYVDIQVIKGAGHHIYADKAEEFNTSINRICRMVDQEQEQGFSAFTFPKRRRTHSDSSLPPFDPQPDMTSAPQGGRRSRYVHRQTSIQEDNEERMSEGDNKHQEDSEPEDLDKDIDTVVFE
ncbi:1-acylglycerol-3-phosphate O-acyltransferase ABHD5 [Lamellibrachia satsuma]|nr:1-acylglycerol-3-phosphate O-acyltransferase ABHD5 [Lamellibrachia satsuma]